MNGRDKGKKELTQREKAAYEIGFDQVFKRPGRQQTTTRRSVHLTDHSLTITEETTYTEEY